MAFFWCNTKKTALNSKQVLETIPNKSWLPEILLCAKKVLRCGFCSIFVSIGWWLIYANSVTSCCSIIDFLMIGFGFSVLNFLTLLGLNELDLDYINTGLWIATKFCF